MPSLKWSHAMAANERGYNPLLGWQFEQLPWNAAVKILQRTTAAAHGVEEAIYSGSQTIEERSPMQVGGTAGVIPSELNTAAVTFIGTAGDRLKIVDDEVLGATPTVDGIIFVEPI